MKHCFETCHEPSCNAGAPCKKMKRRVRAGEAQPSNWVEIEPDDNMANLPIDVAEPDPIAIDRKWFVGVALALVVFWAVVVWGVVL